MLRIAGSMRLGTIHASELIRSLRISERPSSLAIFEVGRINKTIYLLIYVDEEDYRRRILTQLDRTESRYSVAAKIYHGRRGEIRKRYRERQEDQLGALGLVTNTVVLWNTIYMQNALDHLQQNSLEIRDQDIARLSLLLHGHVRVLGHYTFTLPEPILRGEHRPLNQLKLESNLEALDINPDALRTIDAPADWNHRAFCAIALAPILAPRVVYPRWPVAPVPIGSASSSSRASG